MGQRKFVLIRSNRNVAILCSQRDSDANTTIVNRCFFNFLDVIVINRRGRTTRMGFSLTFRVSLNALGTCVRDKVDCPKHFCYILNDFVTVISLETQNFS